MENSYCLNNTYYIAADVNKGDERIVGYYAIDETTGYPCFTDIDNKTVKTFNTLDAAKKFLDENCKYIDGNGRAKFYSYYGTAYFPRVVKLTRMCSVEYTVK